MNQKGCVKTQCCYITLLIVVEGAKTPAKMLTHFHRAWADSRKLNQCPAGAWVRGDPAGAYSAEEAPRATRGKRSAWNENQQSNLIEPSKKKKGKPHLP
jgi:hypothetical protein